MDAIPEKCPKQYYSRFFSKTLFPRSIFPMILSEDRLDPMIARRVQADSKISDEQRTANICALDAFILRQEKFLSDMRNRRGTLVYFTSETRVSFNQRNVICQICVWLSHVSDRAFQLQIIQFQKFRGWGRSMRSSMNTSTARQAWREEQLRR
jgi:hypothetical protein